MKRKITRLEPISDEHSLEIGIQNRIKDPLALLGRQLAVGEFRQVRNGGHAVRVNVEYKDQILDEIKLTGNSEEATVETLDVSKPLERAVEAETSGGSPLCKGWNKNRLEYQFSVGHGGTELFAKENFGYSDWFTFDVKGVEMSQSPVKEVSVEPSTITVGGMPLPRWWSIEDRNHDLSNIKRPDLNFLSMMLVEVSLLFKAYDFYTVPLRQEAGSLRFVSKVTVVDSFGVTYEAKPVIDKTSQKSGWELYTLQPTDQKQFADGRLFYFPNTLPASLEGPDIESVSFVRDPLSNLLWAIEERYEKEGKPVNPADAEVDAQPLPTPKPYYYWDTGDKKLVAPDERDLNAPSERYYGPVALYNPMTNMPEYCIPYKPGFVTTEGEYAFLRSRTREDVAHGPQYHSEIVKESNEIYEDEIPDVGIAVKRAYQVARDYDGNLCFWLGRKKVVDDKKRLSRLLFDFLIEK